VILLSAVIIGIPTIELDEVDSTNDFASRMLEDKDPVRDGTVIWANHQTNGRGQFDAKWLTNKAENLTMSIILKPSNLHIKKQFYLTIISSLSILFLLKLYGIKASIKWPNDCYVGRKKIAGILIQNSIIGHSIRSSIVGIGLNVNQKKFHSSVPNATSFLLESSKDHSILDIRQQLFDCFESYYLDLQNGNLESLMSDYLTSLYQKDVVSTYESHDGKQFGGIIRDVDESGLLHIELEDSTIRAFSLKEIRFL